MVEIGKLKLKNPVLVASGTFGYGPEYETLVNLRKLGGIITKTITLEKREGNSPPRIVETPSGMLNSIGLENPGVEEFIKKQIPYLDSIGVPIIVSIAGKTVEEFRKLAERLDKEKVVDALELNISCPNIKYGEKIMFAQDKKATHEVVAAVRKATDKTIIVKLSPNVTDIIEIARSVQKGGADALSLINTVFGMAIDARTRSPKLGNVFGGLSGPAIKPIALKMIWDVTKVIGIPVIGMGGIMDVTDAKEFLIAGAKAICVGTANFVNPKAVEEIIEGLEKWKD